MMVRISGDFRDKAWWNLLLLAYVLMIPIVVLAFAADLPTWIRAAVVLLGVPLVLLLVKVARLRLRSPGGRRLGD